MGAIRGTIQDGKVVFRMPSGWPEGKEVLVVDPDDAGRSTPSPPVPMMTDEEQGDDPESIAKWLAAFDAIPVAASSPLDDPAVAAWREAMRRHNVEAVRKQMEETPE
jgi:hypothetical protein